MKPGSLEPIPAGPTNTVVIQLTPLSNGALNVSLTGFVEELDPLRPGATQNRQLPTATVIAMTLDAVKLVTNQICMDLASIQSAPQLRMVESSDKG